jgi:hypothetical protein
MKKFYLSFILVIIALSIFCQPNDKKFLIDFAGGFNSHRNNISIGMLENQIYTLSGKTHLGVNYKVLNYLYLGIGFDYQNWREESKNDYDYVSYDNSNSLALRSTSVVVSSIYLPSVNGKLFLNLSKKCLLGLNICTGYGIQYSKKKNTSALNSAFSSELPSYVYSYNSNSDRTFYTLSLEPELVYYLSDRLGIKLQVLAYRYSTNYGSQSLLAIKTPEPMWTLGINFGL